MSVSDSQRANWSAFWVTVAEACSEFEGSMISGTRSKWRNESVGGHPRSRHLFGLAADITFTPGPDARERCRDCFDWLYNEGLHGYIRKSGTSLHIQDRSAKPPEDIG